MESYMDAAILRVVERFSGSSDVKALAIDYLLYGTLAEIFGRQYGFNKGMGGSMHAFFPPFGIMPNNAIVGGSGDIATGAALFKRINRKPGIVIANLGDASMACGPVWEGITLAAMDQYRTLWDKEIGGNPPILFNFMDNFYGMGGQPMGETMGFGVLARRPGGQSRSDARRAHRWLQPAGRRRCHRAQEGNPRAGRGPVLLDTITYRFSGHSPSDASTYREKSEVDMWREHIAGELRALPGRERSRQPGADRRAPRVDCRPVGEGPEGGCVAGDLPARRHNDGYHRRYDVLQRLQRSHGRRGAGGPAA